MVDAARAKDLRKLLELGDEWHGAGTLSDRALEALSAHLARMKPQRSAETGAGRSTILFSWHSMAHTTYALDWGGSVSRALSSELIEVERVRWVDGPTQRTVAAELARDSLDVVLLDGPHGFPFPHLEYFYLYPRLRTGGLLVVDDIQIRSIGDLFRWLRADDMWELAETVDKTAFFHRTGAAGIDPFSDSWWLQGYNQPGRARRILRRITPTAVVRAVRRIRPRR